MGNNAVQHGAVLSRRARFRRSAVAVLAVGLLSLVLQACEGTGSDEDDSERARKAVFPVLGRVESPELWNPFVPGFRDDNGFQAALMEPLFFLNYETGEFESWLGETFVANETLDTWTLTLREGITWSDGEAFDADDVVFTIEMLRDGPDELQHAAAMKEWVDTVTKVDPLTVEFTLTKPNPRFQLDYFAVKIFRSTPIVPEHIWHDKDPLTFTNYDPAQGWPVFTGPYTLADTSPTRFVWERDPDWWGAEAGFLPLPEPEQVEWIVTETEEIAVARAANNELDFLDDITTGAYESLHARNENFVAWNPEPPYSWADPCTRLFSFNTAIEPWNDADMRWAVNFAVDKDEIVRIAYEGSTTEARFFVPPYTSLNRYVDLLEAEGLFEEYPILLHDPDRARELIESKGFALNSAGFYASDGQELSLEIIAPSPAGGEMARYANVIAEQLASIGIDTRVQLLEFGAFRDNLNTGNFEAAADFFACASVSEPWASMQLFHSRHLAPIGEPASNNNVRWSNEVYDEHVDAMENLALGDERIDEHFVAAAREWLRELPFFPAAHAKKLYSFNTTYWTGWPSINDPYVHPPTVWNSSHKIIHNLEPAE